MRSLQCVDMKTQSLRLRLQYANPLLQKFYIRILLIVPVYASLSWLAFRFFDARVYFEVLRGTAK